MDEIKQAPQAKERADRAAAVTSAVQAAALAVSEQVRVAQFRGRAVVERTGADGFVHFEPLHRDQFDRLAYPLLGGISRSRMGDVFSYISNTAIDLSRYDHLISFGGRVWDSRALEWVEYNPDMTIWRSPFKPQEPGRPIPFILSLAGGDMEQYADIMQSLAPIIMERKPDGVIWWVGDGANGKSTLMDALYRIFPGQLASITVRRLVDGRDTPGLNGHLANVVKESSEGRVEDTEIYKAVGTHENFRVHRFHSQDDIEVRGNVHHIFSANTVPTFNDKGWSARRRTFIVPFGQRFESDPNFEDKTFTPEMFGQLIWEMARYAKVLHEQELKYKWSAGTLAAKSDYDVDANNAEEYAKELIAEGVVAFESFGPVRIDYENWCASNGFVPLGVTNLRRAMGALKFERITYQDNTGQFKKHYRLPGFASKELIRLHMDRPGLLTTPGFKPKRVTKEEVAEEANKIIGGFASEGEARPNSEAA